ncbi:sterol desaturase family protein [Lusitaniella coriacea]|uniref:sterol desaturase family protein n=1 Tax=Lusitaniella coriacea TaxID=1983105 RepID=UPI003CF1BF4F
MFPDVLKGFLFLAFVFIPLERGFSLHEQLTFRRGWTTDTLYFVVGNFIGKAAGVAIPAVLALSFLNRLTGSGWQTAISSQPIISQLIEAIFVADLGYYLAHRMLHAIPFLWRFHAIHHSIKYMDWLSTVRVHPVEQIFTKTFQVIPVFCLGFSLKALGLYAIFSSAIAFFIHSNLRFNFGILNWIIVTPQLHHWHHAKEEGILTQNFAAQCPLVDFLFGTFYLPKNKIPARYGVTELIPGGYMGQLFYPFQFKRKRTMKFFQSSLFYQLRPFFIGVGISVLGIGSLTFGAIAHRMDLPTFVSSWTVPKVTATELQQGHLKNVILVDVRTPEEYAEDRISGSVLVPLSEIETGLGVKKITKLAQASSHSEPTIVLYCAAGARSVKAYRRLEQTGLKFVSLAGGINAWREIVSPS